MNDLFGLEIMIFGLMIISCIDPSPYIIPLGILTRWNNDHPPSHVIDGHAVSHVTPIDGQDERGEDQPQISGRETDHVNVDQEFDWFADL